MASIYGLEGNALDPAYAVAPGFIDTDLMAAVPDVMVSMVVDQTPAGRMGTAEEVADAVAFLASERASFCNGEVLTVSGGWAGA